MSRAPNNTRHRPRWTCRCDCGNVHVVEGHPLKRGYSTSCGCKKARLGADSPHWKGLGSISGSVWYNIRKSASRRGIAFDLSIEEAWDVFEDQGQRCALSGMPITIARNRTKCTASLDRIDSAGRYIKTNIQWLHKMVQLMKNVLSQDEFVMWCGLVTECQQSTGVKPSSPFSNSNTTVPA